jgi:hypothetical protein
MRHSRRDSDGEGLPIGINLSRSLRRQLLSIRRPTAFGKSWHTETRRVVVLMVGTYSWRLCGIGDAASRKGPELKSSRKSSRKQTPVVGVAEILVEVRTPQTCGIE